MTQPIGGWGVVNQGFNMKPQAQIQTDIANSVLAQTGQSLDTSVVNPFGQVIGVFAGALAELWEVAAASYEGIDRDNASGAQLDNVGTLTGSLRQAPTSSQVLCSVVLAAGTYIAGSLVASVSTSSLQSAGGLLPSIGQQFKNLNPVTSVGPVVLAGNFNTTGNPTVVPTTQSQSGKVAVGDQVVFGSSSATYHVTAVTGTSITISPAFSGTGAASDTCTDNSTSGILFASIQTGPVIAPAGWLATIAAPVTGWTDVYNGSTASPGVNLQADADYRAMQLAQLSLGGGSTLPALTSALIALFASPAFGLTGAAVNIIDSPSTGSFAVYVYPGSTIANFTGSQLTAIAQTIWNNKPAGVTPTGTTTQTIFDSQNIQRSVAFSLVTVKPVYLKITVAFSPAVVSAGTQGTVAVAIKNAIIFQSQGVTVAGNLLPPGTQGVLVPGGSVFSEPIGAAALSVQGVGSVRTILLGLLNPPTNPNDIWGANDAAIQTAIDSTNPNGLSPIAANQVGGITTAQIQIIDATGASGPFS